MGRSKKVIVISIAVVILAGAVIIAYIAGKNINNRFLGGNQAKLEESTATAAEIDDGAKSQTADESSQNTDEDTGKANTKEQATQQEIKAMQEVKGETVGTDSEEKPEAIKVRAVYLTGNMAGISKSLDHFIELVNTTELNAVVIDIKDNGVVNYESNVPEVKSNQLYKKLYDADSVLKKLHQNNVYVIGRIVCFKDNGYAVKRPDLAIKRPDGTLWRENGKVAWLNPYNEDAWKYNIEIAKEAIEKGFDEIQFDYVRFPAARAKDVNYGVNLPAKADAICGFLETADKELRQGKGAVVSADIFGIICESVRDGQAIGQDLERIGKSIDYICPMVYPSHYANAGAPGKVVMGNGVGQTINGVKFTAPDLKPYEVVYNTLMKAKDRISKVEGYNAIMRPYLQDFTATYISDKQYYQVYGAEQVRQQIKAVYDAGYEEWILWNAGNVYSENAFEKDSGQ